MQRLWRLDDAPPVRTHSDPRLPISLTAATSSAVYRTMTLAIP